MTGQQLKNSILQEAIQGKLVSQRSEDGRAADLIDQICIEKKKFEKQTKGNNKNTESSIFRKDISFFERIGAKEECIDENIPFSIPKNWEWVRLGNIANTYTGNSIAENIKVKKYTNLTEGYNYIGTKDIGFDHSINYENGIKIPKDEIEFKHAFPGDILLCIEGGSAGKKIGILTEQVCFGNKLCCFAQYLKQTRYLYYFLQSPLFFSSFTDKISGIIGGVSREKLGNLLVPLPPLAEQERIVAKIEELLLLVDSLLPSEQ